MHPWIRLFPSRPAYTTKYGRKENKTSPPQWNRKELAKLKEARYLQRHEEREGWSRSIIPMVSKHNKNNHVFPGAWRDLEAKETKKLFESLIGNRRFSRRLSLRALKSHRQTKIFFRAEIFSFVEWIFLLNLAIVSSKFRNSWQIKFFNFWFASKLKKTQNVQSTSSPVKTTNCVSNLLEINSL